MQIQLISYTFQRERGFEFQYKSLNFPPSYPDYPWCHYERVQRRLLKSDSLTLHVQASEDWVFGISILYFFFFCILLFPPFIYITGHLYFITDSKIPFIRFQLCITDYRNKWSGEGQDIVKLITSPLIKLQFYLG